MKPKYTDANKTRQLGLRASTREEAIISAAVPLTMFRSRGAFVLAAVVEASRKVLRDRGVNEDDVLAAAGFPMPTVISQVGKAPTLKKRA